MTFWHNALTSLSFKYSQFFNCSIWRSKSCHQEEEEKEIERISEGGKRGRVQVYRMKGGKCTDVQNGRRRRVPIPLALCMMTACLCEKKKQHGQQTLWWETVERREEG
jgi:hypothetical protein